MRLEELKSENGMFIGILLAVAAISSFAMLRFGAVRTVLGFAALVFLPFYLIFNSLDLQNGEKAMFALFSSIALFPSFAYWLGFIVPFKAAMAITFIVLVVAAYAVKKWLKKRST